MRSVIGTLEATIYGLQGCGAYNGGSIALIVFGTYGQGWGVLGTGPVFSGVLHASTSSKGWLDKGFSGSGLRVIESPGSTLNPKP